MNLEGWYEELEVGVFKSFLLCKTGLEKSGSEGTSEISSV
jgi:hypothetical protein